MIGYVCKYTPVEVLCALDADPVRVEPTTTNFDRADTCMHPNVCSFAKAVLEDMEVKDYEGMVLTTCCDSIRRLYDTLRLRYPDKFFYLLDVPRKVDDHAIDLYAARIFDLIDTYRAFSGHAFRADCLVDLLVRQDAEARLRKVDGRQVPLRIGLVGARYSAGITRLLQDNATEVAFDLTCIGQKRNLGKGLSGAGGEMDDKRLIRGYAAQLLGQLSCMRMVDATDREAFLRRHAEEVDGIIYHTVKFCDNFGYEYALLHAESDFALLKVETDATRQCEGQIRTRVEAFVESLKAAKGIGVVTTDKTYDKDGTMYVMGIDSGSTSTNAVILDGDKKIVAHEVVRTGAKASLSAQRALEGVLAKAGLGRVDLSLIVSTGYGRVSVDFADIDVTEISCHGKGAWYFNPAIRTILDIGGQDSKAIRLDETGEVVDFAMNDKCAAGTGRFLEAMARTLEVDIAELGPLSFESHEEVEISSMCTVFAESEVITLIANNTEKADIAQGVHSAIAGKSYSLLRRVGPEPGYMMTGGVAKNPGVVRALEKRLGTAVYICPEPEIVGAVGAALFGFDSFDK